MKTEVLHTKQVSHAIPACLHELKRKLKNQFCRSIWVHWKNCWVSMNVWLISAAGYKPQPCVEVYSIYFAPSEML